MSSKVVQAVKAREAQRRPAPAVVAEPEPKPKKAKAKKAEPVVETVTDVEPVEVVIGPEPIAAYTDA